MAVVVETRYGGVYEGGCWAASDVEDEAAVPGEAFGGDVTAAEWWWRGPSVLVGVGDSPDEALDHLASRRGGTVPEPRYAVGDVLRVARCAPSEWHADEIGRVQERRVERFDGRYRGSLEGQWSYLLLFSDGSSYEAPDPYLRALGDAGARGGDVTPS